jgi:hypothetical protein
LGKDWQLKHNAPDGGKSAKPSLHQFDSEASVTAIRREQTSDSRMALTPEHRLFRDSLKIKLYINDNAVIMILVFIFTKSSVFCSFKTVFLS